VFDKDDKERSQFRHVLMPTIYLRPRKRSFPFYYRVAERMALRKMSAYLMIFGLFAFVHKSARNAGSALRRSEIILPLMATVTAAMLQEEIWIVRSTFFTPPSDTEKLRFQSRVWNGEGADEMFSLRYRFRRGDFADMLLRMKLATEYGNGLRFKSLRSRHRYRIPADFAMMVMLRRLGYPCRFADLVCEFGQSTTYICEAFHIAIDYIFFKYARGGMCPFLWESAFPSFARAFSDLGSPIPTIIGLMDGTFMAVARPGGMGNYHHQVDQRLFYSGKEKMHGLKWLAVVLGNGMVCIRGPYPGSFHDTAMLRLSGWLEKFKSYHQRIGIQLHFFADSGFPNEDHVITMIKGYVTLAGLTFNALMSRIRIFIENAFAGQFQVFNFFSFKHKLYPGGRNIDRMYIVASFMMNMYTTYYGSQFTAAMEEAGVDLHVDTDDLLMKAEAASAC
jgi:hypothetical protein